MWLPDGCNLSHTHKVGTRPVLSRTFSQAGYDCERPQVQGRPVVNYLGRDRAYGAYQVTQLLPPKGKVFNFVHDEPHARKQTLGPQR